MSYLITKELLTKAEEDLQNEIGFASLNEAVELHATRASRSTETTVFLSHKHTDKELVRKAISLFKSLGSEVYVDWLDKSLPPTTGFYTAQNLKKRIRNCNKFVLLATDDAIESKWCNWELGLGDASKYSENIAILPAGNRGQDWKGSEYIGIYPIITSGYQYVTGNYYVEFRNNKTPLKEWLEKK